MVNNLKRSAQMLEVQEKEFWFVVGSQHLYGPEALREVQNNAKKIVETLNEEADFEYPLVYKSLVTTAEEIRDVMKEVNYQDTVAGVITWMHTFSPAKMWIPGTKRSEEHTSELQSRAHL